MRQLASYQEKLDELDKLGVSVVAVTTEDREAASEMASRAGIAFPAAYGVSEDDVRELDPWWAEDNHGRYLQPMEFLILRPGIVFGSMYASGPIGRMAVDEAIASVRRREQTRTARQ